MTITDALRGEHAVFYLMFDRVLGRGAPTEDLEVAATSRALHGTILAHAGAEDELLFQALDPYFPGAGPLSCMREEHEEIERAFAAAAQGGPAARPALARAVELARDHFLKEEEVLFSLAEQHLDSRRLTELGTEWAARRGVRLPRHAAHS